MSAWDPIPMSEKELVVNGVSYTYRTAAEIRELIIERDRLWAEGKTEEGNIIKTQLKFTALRPKGD
jgi:hypothetical protein